MNARREFLLRSGALVVSFSMLGRALAQELPGSLRRYPFLDSWIRVDPDNSITILSGKAELGQGIKTALLQIAAEELDVDIARLKIITADTMLTANEGYTAGSNSLRDSGVSVRAAAAQARGVLVAEAGKRWGASPETLRVEDGTVIAGDGRRVSYGELVSGRNLHVEAQPAVRNKDPKQYRVLGKPLQRVDIPAKVTGGAAYVQDMRLPGMLHARVVFPPGYGATLESVDTASVEKMPRVVKVLRDGNFLAVVAEREWTAVKAMRALAASCKWREQQSLPDAKNLAAAILALPAQDLTIHDKRAAGEAAAKTIEATYTRPYQMHGSIGPSCAVAHMKDGALTIWTHTQGVYPDRDAISEMLGLAKEKVRCIHVEGSGCYGHNGADDAAADAALIATLMPGVPVRVQWMREQEHAWEPYGPAMVAKVRASLDAAGRIVDWDYGVWSNIHSMRPGPAGSLIAAQHMSKAFKLPVPQGAITPEGLGDRNAIPLYALPTAKVVHHFLAKMPVRVSALRALGAYVNVFAIESFMDELATAAGIDPVAFRLRHLEDPRGRDVIRTAAEKFGWKADATPPRGRGYGFAFGRYKNAAAYCAIACEVAVDAKGRARVVRAVAAVDSGQVVNPDGLRNQIEGAILQSSSWTLYEKVAFDASRITSTDWASYPILRFDAVPDRVDVHIIDRPGQPFLGSGEAGQGPTAGAIANAIFHATGKRLRDLPLSA